MRDIYETNQPKLVVPNGAISTGSSFGASTGGQLLLPPQNGDAPRITTNGGIIIPPTPIELNPQGYYLPEPDTNPSVIRSDITKGQALGPIKFTTEQNGFTPFALPTPSPHPRKNTNGHAKKNGKHYPIRKPERWEGVYPKQAEFYIAKLSPLCTIPKQTLRWIRNASDERAAQEGMRFHEQSGQIVVDWVEEHCILYEGSRANTPLICDDWQYEYFMQLFGWMRHTTEVQNREWIRRFTQAGIWIAKKNAKSPTLAATGLYMFAGEGEQGQKCYSVARDGKQATIAHMHVVEMIWNSPKLDSICKVRLSDLKIICRKYKSTYTIVAGDNTRSSQSTEGFNGSLFVDETHVVDQTHMDRLKRAGISRDEPLHVEMSTAGNNADGYGYNRYQYGQRVAKMERDDDYNPHFLFIDHSIDQTVTMEKLRDRDFVLSVCQKCNPAMGRIIRREQYVSDWQESCQSETELRQFAMYRLNLWLRDSAIWVELGDWLRCSESPLSQLLTEQEGSPTQYILEDLQAYPCVAGVDLSLTRDMTALTLVFAVPDENLNVRPYTWTWHWLPEPTAQKYQRFVNFKSDDFRDWLYLVKTKTVDYSAVANKLAWVRENFDLRGIGYDVWNSSQFLTHLINDYGWDEQAIFKVPQKMQFMGPITKTVERWIIRQEVHHPDNKLLNWQFQHAALDEDKNGNYRVMKPEKGDYRKVDGIISMLIASIVLLLPEINLWSRDNGSILLFDAVEDPNSMGTKIIQSPESQDTRSAYQKRNDLLDQFYGTRSR